ncbi:MAG: alpha/beta fold hydrolase [Planctomycetia bacterium]|nr:alpha/beta fold hydrolase [Planctomycetia bacterium]
MGKVAGSTTDSIERLRKRMAEPPLSEEYPFAWHELSVQGLRYHYLDEGEGPVLLMLHGNPTWSFYWRNLVKGLRDRFRVIVPDHIGCGLSEKPGLGEYPFTLERRIEDVLALVESLQLREITLVAHDWGGAIGMGAAVAAPERFRQFLLCNTGAFRFASCPWRIRVCRVPWLGDWAVKGGNVFARAAIRMAVEKRLSPTVRAGLLAPYDNWHNRLATHEFVRDIPLSPRDRSYETLVRVEEGLSQFRNHPVTLLWGMRDWCFTPAFLKRFQEIFPQAQTYPFPDAGHYLVEDAWEEILPVIRRRME